MRYLLSVLLGFFATVCVGQEDAYRSLDPDDPILLGDGYFVYGGDTTVLGPRAFFLDGRLTDTQIAERPYIFNSVQDAVAHLRHGTEADPMVLYLAPWVYWIDDPDNPTVRLPEAGRGVPYGMEISCEWLRFEGLTRHAENVILASNRGQTMGAEGNFTMFRFDGDGTSAENVTFGNYCNVDLEYPLAPELNRPKRGEAIVQAQLIHCNGDKIVARNVRFISRLNLCPFVGGKRTLFDRCHFECTDDALAGSAVYKNSTFTFFSSKPWYHTTGTGVVLLNCDIRSYTGGAQYFTKSDGQLAVVDTRFTSETVHRIDWRDNPPPTTKNYQHGVLLNATPVTIGNLENTVPLTGEPLLAAYCFTDSDSTVYNTYNLLGGDDDWDPEGIQPRLREAEERTGRSLTDLPTQLRLAPDKVDLETGRDSTTVTATYIRFGNYPAAGARVQWSVDGADADLVVLRPATDGLSCRVIPTNRLDTARAIVLTARSPSGLEGASAVRVRPARLPAPRFVEPPRLERIGKDSLRVAYTLEEGPYADESLITWYRCADAGCRGPTPVAVSRGGVPRRGYRLTAADAGYYLMVSVAPRHLRSDPGPELKTQLQQALTAGGLPSVDARISTDFSGRAVTDQPRTLPGFWTFAPLVVPDTKEPPPAGDAWTYGPGSGGSEGMTGLLQRGRTASLSYTPVGDSFGAMKATVTVTPFKTAGQGFSVAPLYMDVLVKYDALRKTGYGLRLKRGTRYGNAVEAYLIQYVDGVATALTAPVPFSGFRPSTRIELSVTGAVLRVRATTDAEYDAGAYAPEVVSRLDLQAPVSVGYAGGFGIEYNGGSTTLINSVELEWY